MLCTWVSPCQWCHRVLVARALLNLENVEIRYVVPGDDGLWKLPDGSQKLLRDIYLEREPAYSGRFTAPLMVESREQGGVLSNESEDILRALGDMAGHVVIDEDTNCLAPTDEREQI